MEDREFYSCILNCIRVGRRYIDKQWGDWACVNDDLAAIEAEIQRREREEFSRVMQEIELRQRRSYAAWMRSPQ